MRLTVEDRFWSKVNKTTGCWLYTGAVTHQGYGRFRMPTRTLSAHRVSWEMAYGGHPCTREPLSSEVFVCHHCDVDYAKHDPTYKRCVRPDHLFLGTTGDNQRDAAKEGRSSMTGGDHFPQGAMHVSRAHPELLARGERQHLAHLTDEHVRTLRLAYAVAIHGRRRVPRGWVTAMARRLGVTDSTIKKAASGRTWGHVAAR